MKPLETEHRVKPLGKGIRGMIASTTSEIGHESAHWRSFLDHLPVIVIECRSRL